MKTRLQRVLSLLCALSLLVLWAGCIKDEKYTSASGGGGEGGSTPVDPDGTDVTEAVEKLFPLLNLDYPGLEKVKENYQKEEYYLAAQALLEYYRERTSVVHTDITLVGVTATKGDRKWADYSLENKFQSTNTLDPPHYYPFIKDPEDNKKEKINWFPLGITDNEELWQVHRHKWMIPLAKLYRETGDDSWVKAWKAQYGDWAYYLTHGKDDGIDKLAWRGLEVGHRITDQTKLFVYFLPSKQFTPKWLCTFLYHFYDHVHFISGKYTGSGNHLITQAQGESYAGILFPEFKDAATWAANGINALNTYITEQTLEDGFQYELDFSYHIGAISDFYLTLDLAIANGKGSLFPQTYYDRMRKMTDVVMNLTYPDYSVPNMNDTRKIDYTKSVLTRNFRTYFRLFPDNREMEWMAESGNKGTKPTHFTKAFDKSGYYVLKSGWDQKDIMMVLQDGPRGAGGGWHSQPDNGTFEIYVNGRNFFTDSGVYKYSGNAEQNQERAWFRQTRVHNTMTLGFENIADTDANRNGKLLKMETLLPKTELLVIENPSYTGLKHRRAVFFVNREFFVIVDEGIGDAAGSVNINFNMLGVKDIATADVKNAVLDAPEFGAHTIFADNNNMIVRSFASVPLTFAPFEGRVSEKYGEYAERNGCWSVSIDKTAGDAAARFITVILPVKGKTDSVNIDAQFTDSGYAASGASVKVTLDGVVYDLSYTL